LGIVGGSGDVSSGPGFEEDPSANDFCCSSLTVPAATVMLINQLLWASLSNSSSIQDDSLLVQRLRMAVASEAGKGSALPLKQAVQQQQQKGRHAVVGEGGKVGPAGGGIARAEAASGSIPAAGDFGGVSVNNLGLSDLAVRCVQHLASGHLRWTSEALATSEDAYCNFLERLCYSISCSNLQDTPLGCGL